MQAAFKPDQVNVVGRYSDYARVSDEIDRKEHVFHFCPECGSQVFYTEPTEPDLIVVSVGAFADPSFPPPTEWGYDSRRHPWVTVPAGIGRYAPELWAPLHPLYESGEYTEAADRGRELLEEHPEYGDLFYNVACCESLAGRTAEALEHLGRAIDLSEPFRAVAKDDSDFDPIRDEPAFEELIGR
jgi:Glutathione-dependent formaldehyde-activating enzyme